MQCVSLHRSLNQVLKMSRQKCKSPVCESGLAQSLVVGVVLLKHCFRLERLWPQVTQACHEQKSLLARPLVHSTFLHRKHLLFHSEDCWRQIQRTGTASVVLSRFESTILWVLFDEC